MQKYVLSFLRSEALLEQYIDGVDIAEQTKSLFELELSCLIALFTLRYEPGMENGEDMVWRLVFFTHIFYDQKFSNGSNILKFLNSFLFTWNAL